MNIRLLLHVVLASGIHALWRDITMPALPPIKSFFTTSWEDLDCLTVEYIWYQESLQLFVIEFEEYDIHQSPDCELNPFIAAGWNKSTMNEEHWTTPFIEGKST